MLCVYRREGNFLSVYVLVRLRLPSSISVTCRGPFRENCQRTVRWRFPPAILFISDIPFGVYEDHFRRLTLTKPA